VSMEHFQVNKAQQRSGGGDMLGEHVLEDVAHTLARCVGARVVCRVSIVVRGVEDAGKASRKLLRDRAVLFGGHDGIELVG